jgi:RimJ/RimL family protein N-acetyltransferase
VTADVELRAWTLADLWLMERLLGDPAMTEHIGGPESAERIRERLEDYQQIGDPDAGRMFVITLGPQRLAVGSIGFWGIEWRGEPVWESGWSVLPEAQGRGVATAALGLVIAKAAAQRRRGSIHAFPSIDNVASNAVCRKAGLTCLGSSEFEYPEGHFMRCYDWVIDLDVTSGHPPPDELVR